VARSRAGLSEAFTVAAANVSYDPSIDIEERELHYSLETPLRAWRLFRVRP
jgi:hypothetical protein